MSSYAETVRSEMATVRRNAERVGDAMERVDRWVGDRTWQGGSSEQWEAEWSANRAAVRRFLAALPDDTNRLIRAAEERDRRQQHQAGTSG